ncbi:Ferredoxin, plant-type [Cupriavidus taiwanensis]|uniref:2Fe-2S iron-sulfur cluster binding domain-containing protein n=1 Tax=Cupriavidus TaxID=106589 RepID=UPI000E1838BF|nr:MULTISPECIES: 2Fe-2S iron-sulfur cluster binding domain-containing protein [Cupriavidus]MBB3015783.1 ferredoxin [Cupriavidus alkaliphilus]SPA02925.1 Ferredoxin, plant-type [Cupriavidus taiwanensis]SPA22140.1 Ferredoxin, plant-type [Cupriavidus taiwanensis]
MHTVEIADSGQRYACAPGQNLLRAMEVLGQRGIPAGCRGGGCGVCKVRIEAGQYHVGKMSRACLSEAEQRAGLVLACKTYPDSDIRLQPVALLQRCLARHAGARDPA